MIRTRLQNKKNRKKFRFKRILSLIFIFILLPVSIYFGFISYKAYTAAGKSFNELERGTQSELRTEEVKISKDPVSILLIGLENYSSNFKGGRTDSLIVATFNPELKTVKLLSIPRDTYVYIDSLGDKDKITHAYGSGGRDETINSVENLLDIPIDYYVEVNFKGFKKIVDELGGVDVEVPFDFYEYTDVPPIKKITFEQGQATLNGDEALAYARMRKQDPRGDFGRNERQKEIIKSLITKASTPENLLKIDELAFHVGENVQTNIKMSEPLAFFKKYNGFSTQSIESLKIEGEDTYIDDIYYFSPNEESLTNVITNLQQHLDYTKENESPTSTESN